MKKIVLIVGGIAAALVAATTLFAWFALNKTEKDFNAKKTEPARAARWKDKREPEPEPETETQKENVSVNQ